MATIADLTYLATQTGYNRLDVPAGFSNIRNWAIQPTGGYSGQLISSTTNNEYFLVNRGSVTAGNWLSDDILFGSLLGTGIGLGATTTTFEHAQEYAMSVFDGLAAKLKRGEPIDTIYLTGHSLGYAESVAQYEALLGKIKSLSNSTQGTDQQDLVYYMQLKDKVRLFGVNGTGVPNSNMPAGSLDAIATNLVLNGDIADHIGLQYGTKITLDGAGSGYGTVAFGVVLGLVASTPMGALLFGIAGGLWGNHEGRNANTYMGQFPAFSGLDEKMLANYTAAEQQALKGVDPLSWQAMSDLERKAMLIHPVEYVEELRANGLTPAKITPTSTGLLCEFSNGVSYLYQNTDGIKSYVFRQDGIDSVAIRVDAISTTYNFPDGSSNVTYNEGQSLWTLPDRSTLYMLNDGSGQLQVNGQQFDIQPGDQPYNNAGIWTITSQTTQWTTTTQINPDGGVGRYDLVDIEGNSTRVVYGANSTVTYQHEASTRVDTVTSQIDGNYFETSFNPATSEFSYSFNNGTPYTLDIRSDTGNNILFGGTGTVTAIVDGKEVVFSVAFNSDNLAEPGGMQLTGIISVDGAVDTATIAGINAAMADAGMKVTDLAAGSKLLKVFVVEADLFATPEELAAVLNAINSAPSVPFSEWVKANGAQTLNGLGALIRSLDSHSSIDQINGTVWLASSIGNYIYPNTALSGNLNIANQWLGWWNTYASLSNALNSGDSKAIMLASLNATVSYLNHLNTTQNITTGATPGTQNEYGQAASYIGYAMAAYSAGEAFERKQYLDAVMDIVGAFYPFVGAIYNLEKVGIQYGDTHDNGLGQVLKGILSPTKELHKIASDFLTSIFGGANQYAWGEFSNRSDGSLTVRVVAQGHDGGGDSLAQIHASILGALQTAVNEANEQAKKQALVTGTGTAVELGILADGLMRTRFETKNGNFIGIYDVGQHDNPFTNFEFSGRRRFDNAGNDSFGQNYVEVFIRDVFNKGAVLPMWDIKTILAQRRKLGTYAEGLVPVYESLITESGYDSDGNYYQIISDVLTGYSNPQGGATTQGRYQSQGLWLANDAGKSTDGHAGKVLWQSATTAPSKTASLLNSSIFAASTNGTNILKVGDVLHGGESIASSNGRFLLQMGTDGNVVLLDQQSANSQPVWSTSTSGSGNYFKISSTGALVVYSSGGTVLWSAPNATSAKVLTLQDNGILALTNQEDAQDARVIAIDLNGDGVIVKSTKADGVLYDIDDDGYAEAIEWISSKDGMLVLDRNGDASVKGGHELFYDSQVNMAGVGLNVLKEIDANYDFKINATDYAFNYLQVWQDINRDGVIQVYELKHLADLNITQIDFSQGSNTAYKELGSVTINGVSHLMKSEVLQADATGYATSMAGNSLFVEQEGLSKDGEVTLTSLENATAGNKISLIALATQDLGKVGSAIERASHTHSLLVNGNTITVVDDRIDAQQGFSVSVLASQLLGNDKGNNGNNSNLQITYVHDALHGKVSLEAESGRIIFTPDVGFASDDASNPAYGQFSYEVLDSITGLTRTATVMVNVLPSTEFKLLSNSLAAGVQIDGISYSSPHVGNLSTQNIYDTSRAVTGLHYAVVQAPLYGSLYLNEKTGAWSYSTGSGSDDAFTAVVQDGLGNSAQLKVIIDNHSGDGSFKYVADTAGNTVLQLNSVLERISPALSELGPIYATAEDGNQYEVGEVTDPGGNDTVLATVDALLSNTVVENVILQGAAALDAKTNGSANRLYGNQGDNRLDGGAGADVMVGGAVTTFTLWTMRETRLLNMPIPQPWQVCKLPTQLR